MVDIELNPSENGLTLDARSSAPTRLIIIWSTHMAPTVQQLQTLFPTPSCQGFVEAANSKKPDIDLYVGEGGGGETPFKFW